MSTGVVNDSRAERGGSSILADSTALRANYAAVRQASCDLCRPLVPEDYVIQSMPDASPAKWHLAHTTWFFEAFILARSTGYQPVDPRYNFLFNSYYVALGERHCRSRRGLISRPTIDEVYRYREQIDDRMLALIDQADAGQWTDIAPLVEIGLHHEQQHQELLLTDLKHMFWSNPLRPAYQNETAIDAAPAEKLGWVEFPETLAWIGHDGSGFAYDNEGPRHRAFIHPFALASRLVTAGEYLEFMRDGGYEQPQLWLSDGWAARQSQDWEAPLYWERDDGGWLQMTLSGMRPLLPGEPLCHVSYYEADAFARWSGARLPSEEEWELAAADCPLTGSFVEAGRLHPGSDCATAKPLRQMFGEAWQWTRSAYLPYPGYRQSPGALGEYNGKFMCNQSVLRGGSCATPRSHIRRTYRNFFPPQARWQFSGIRLAKDY